LRQQAPEPSAEEELTGRAVPDWGIYLGGFAALTVLWLLLSVVGLLRAEGATAFLSFVAMGAAGRFLLHLAASQAQNSEGMAAYGLVGQLIMAAEFLVGYGAAWLFLRLPLLLFGLVARGFGLRARSTELMELPEVGLW
jgi:hypothetical protein